MLIPRIPPTALALPFLIISNSNILANAEADALFSSSLHSLSSNLSPNLWGELLLSPYKSAPHAPSHTSRHSVHPLPSPVPFPPHVFSPVKDLEPPAGTTNDGLNNFQKMAHESQSVSTEGINADVSHESWDRPSGDRHDDVASHSLSDSDLFFTEASFTFSETFAHVPTHISDPIPSTPPRFIPPAYLHGVKIKEHAEAFEYSNNVALGVSGVTCGEIAVVAAILWTVFVRIYV